MTCFKEWLQLGYIVLGLEKIIIAFLTLHTWPEWILRSKSNKCRTLLCILITGISKLQNFKKCPQKAKKTPSKVVQKYNFFSIFRSELPKQRKRKNLCSKMCFLKCFCSTSRKWHLGKQRVNVMANIVENYLDTGHFFHISPARGLVF